MTQPSHHIPEDVGISRLLHTSPPSEWQTPGARVKESNPPVPHDSFAVVQREWGSALNPDALNKCPRDSTSRCQDSAHGNAQQWLCLRDAVENNGIRRAGTTAFLQPPVHHVDGGEL